MSADELRTIQPEHVSEYRIVVPMERQDEDGGYYIDDTPQDRYKAIVGDNTHRVYTIRSDRYHAVQHQDIVESLVQTSYETGIRVFGKLDDRNGNLNVHAYFADPDCNIDLSGHHSDPVMLGVRVYNSHNGSTRFGAMMTGVRYLCSNMVGFGSVLGEVSWNHRAEGKDIVAHMTDMITRAFDRVPVLQDRIEAMKAEELTLDEAECALWGISLNPYKVEAISTHLEGLNQEYFGNPTQFDLWNAGNAYTTYSVSGGSYQSKNNELGHMELLMNDPAGFARIIDKGHIRREEYIKTLNLESATVVGD